MKLYDNKSNYYLSELITLCTAVYTKFSYFDVFEKNKNVQNNQIIQNVQNNQIIQNIQDNQTINNNKTINGDFFINIILVFQKLNCLLTLNRMREHIINMVNTETQTNI